MNKGRKIVVILRNQIPVAFADNMKEAQNKVVRKFGYEGITYDHLKRITNCEAIYTFTEITEEI